MIKIEAKNIVECYRMISHIIFDNLYDKNNRFVIMHKDIEKYDELISGMLRFRGVFCNRNYKISIFSDKICEMVISLLNLIKYDFEIEFFIDFLCKSNYVEYEHLVILKKYLELHRIKDLSKEFTINPFLDKEDDDVINLERLSFLNKIRNNFILFLDNIKSKFNENGLKKLIFLIMRENFCKNSEYVNIVSDVVENIEYFEDIDTFISKFIKKVSNIYFNDGKGRVQLLSNFEIDLNEEIIFVVNNNIDFCYKYDNFKELYLFSCQRNIE